MLGWVASTWTSRKFSWLLVPISCVKLRTDLVSNASFSFSKLSILSVMIKMSSMYLQYVVGLYVGSAFNMMFSMWHM